MCKYVNMRALVCVYVYISSAARFVSILFSYSFVVSLSLSIVSKCFILSYKWWFYTYIYIYIVYRQTRVVLYCIWISCINYASMHISMPGMIDDFSGFPGFPDFQARKAGISRFHHFLSEISGDPKAPNPNYSNILAVLVWCAYGTVLLFCRVYQEYHTTHSRW